MDTLCFTHTHARTRTRAHARTHTHTHTHKHSVTLVHTRKTHSLTLVYRQIQILKLVYAHSKPNLDLELYTRKPTV
jgi:hypothetical protein